MLKNTNRKKIAYYSINDPLDKRSWSGITYYLGETLEKNIGDVHYLGPVKIPWLLDKTFRSIQKLSRLLFKTEWIPKYSLLKNKYAAMVLKRRMKGREYDFIFAPAAASELSLLITNIPIVYFNDATFKIYSEAYKREFHNMGWLSRWEGNYLEKRALQNSALVILTSQWAIDSAVRDYRVPTDRMELLLFGANIDRAPDLSVIFNKEENETLTLLFLAVDWERKGGAFAFDTLLYLHERGYKAKLIVCGCIPPAEYIHSSMQVIPFIDKNLSSDYKFFTKMLAEVHFLLLPTRADCSLLVAMEANAYGVPAITTSVGGVPDVVQDGINGYCLPLSDGGDAYGLLIAQLFTDKTRYRELIRSSRKRFETDLNWDKWAEHFKAVLPRHKL